jgi:hypothetical protein
MIHRRLLLLTLRESINVEGDSLDVRVRKEWSSASLTFIENSTRE